LLTLFLCDVFCKTCWDELLSAYPGLPSTDCLAVRVESGGLLLRINDGKGNSLEIVAPFLLADSKGSLCCHTPTTMLEQLQRRESQKESSPGCMHKVVFLQT
jgi:hypothetical protein